MTITSSPVEDDVSAPRRPRSHGRALAALTGVIVLLLVVCGPLGALVRATDAAWTDQGSATSSFTAGTVGAVRNLTCTDSRGLLGLFNNQLRLDWDRPAGIPSDVPVTYTVTWNGGTLGSQGTANVTSPSYLYTAAPQLLSLSLTFTIRPTVGTWQGDTVTLVVSQLVVLLSVVLRCP